jgi:flagellar protein FliO/FliZ
VCFRRPAAHQLGTVLLASVLAVLLCPTIASAAKKAKAPAFHRDETPLPAALRTPAAAHVSTHAGSTGGTLARTIVGLAIVLAVLFGVYWLLKTYAKGNKTKGDGRLEIVATTPLAPNRAVHLIRVGDGLVLVGSAEGSVTQLKTYDDAESAAIQTRLDEVAPIRTIAPDPHSKRGIVDELRRMTVRK